MPPAARLGSLLLVVDDDWLTAEKLASWLTSQGLTAVAAHSSVEAHAVMAATPIVGLIGHLGLRDGSLFALSRDARARNASIVVGYSEADVPTPPELDAYFLSPIDREALRAFLRGRFGLHPSSGHYPATSTSIVTNGIAVRGSKRS